jgi:cytochrome c oxidase subunit 2
VQKGWSILFGAVLLASFLLTALAPLFGWWLPKNVASFGGEVDLLFYVILGFTGFFFVLTEVILVYAMFRYTQRPGHKAEYTHGNHRLELAWTIIPAAILLFIAFTQVKTWADIKYQSQMPEPEQVLEVTARQWEWRMRYPIHPDEKGRYRTANPAEWAQNPQFDDLHGVNELHVWKDANVKIYLKTQDVLHSFFLPNLRLKQDALPGKTIPVWFKVTESNTRFDRDKGTCDEPTNEKDRWEITCAELCGGRHYAMRGKFYVHPDKADFEAWLKHEIAKQNSRYPEERAAANSK